jgi:NTP pyrophosphatase (non-canonical NTP hydrolase)
VNYSFGEYQAEALVTAASHSDTATALANWSMGLAGETGELVDELKKVLFHKKPLDSKALRKEIGDVLWYLTVLADHLGFHLGQVAQENIEGLRARHGDSFKPHNEQVRDD